MKLSTEFGGHSHRYRIIAGIALSLASLCFAQPGSLDVAFNAGSLRGSVLTIAVQPDQRILAGGALAAGSSHNIVRLHPDGSIDETFRTGAGPNDVVTGIALQADGKVLLGGRFTEFNGVAVSGIVRLTADGLHDSTFSAGAAPDGFVTAIKVQPDGRVLVAGELFSYVPTSHRALVRLLPNGEVDETFHVEISPVYVDWAGIRAIELLPDGRIYVTGPFSAINGAPRYGVARLLANGSVDRAFAASDYPGSAIAVQPDGKVIVGGGFAAGPIGVVRLNPDGSDDGTFRGPLDSGADPEVHVIALQPDGRVLVGGVNFHVAVDEAPTIRDETLIRLEPDGDLETNFLSGVQISAHGYASALAVLLNGKILVGVRETGSGTPLFRFNNELVTGIEFTSTSFLVNEGDGVANITVRRTGPRDRPARVRLNIEDGTATARQDYLGSSQWLTFRPGEAQKTVQIAIRQDSLAEDDETVLLSLDEPRRGDLALRTSAILIIRDDDRPPPED